MLTNRSIDTLGPGYTNREKAPRQSSNLVKRRETILTGFLARKKMIMLESLTRELASNLASVLRDNLAMQIRLTLRILRILGISCVINNEILTCLVQLSS
jgi:hypothetical protein